MKPGVSGQSDDKEIPKIKILDIEIGVLWSLYKEMNNREGTENKINLQMDNEKAEVKSGGNLLHIYSASIYLDQR